MNIEEILKKHDIPKIRFAQDFNLSRPTFYDYASKFDKNETLPKQKYQIIFEELFSKPLSHEEFIHRYNKYSRIYKRDTMMKLAELDPDNTDSITRIVDELRLSVDANHTSELIPFINFFVSNYKKEKVFSGWLLYFNILNGLNDSVNELTKEEKWFLGNLYHINRSYLDGKTSTTSYFEEFEEKRKDLKIEKSYRKSAIEEELQKALSPYITDAIKNAPEGVDNEEIIKRVLERINANQ